MTMRDMPDLRANWANWSTRILLVMVAGLVLHIATDALEAQTENALEIHRLGLAIERLSVQVEGLDFRISRLDAR